MGHSSLLQKKKKPVFGLYNQLLPKVHCFYTHLQKQNKNMRKHMLLSETVTKLFWDTSQFPALPATAWCSGQCTEPRASTWPALQPYGRSRCPNPTWGSA